MKILKKKKNKDELNSLEENRNEVEPEEALEKATDSVVSDLPQGKRKKYVRKNWGDRPEHLQKPIGEMTDEEKKEYRLWQAGELKIETKEENKPVYAEEEIYAVGYIFLPILCKRLPNPLPPSEQEIQGFAKVMTPLINKYVTAFAYKEEVNALLFALAFLIPRSKKILVEVSSQEYTG